MPKLDYRIVELRMKTLEYTQRILHENPNHCKNEKNALLQIFNKSRKRNFTGFDVSSGFNKFYNQYKIFKTKMKKANIFIIPI